MAELLKVIGILSDKAKGVLEISGDDWYFVDYPPIDIQFGKYGQYEILESMDQYQKRFSCVPKNLEVVVKITGIDKSLLRVTHAWYNNESGINISI